MRKGAMTSTIVSDVTSAEQLDALIETGARLAVNFWAAWAEPCVVMNGVFGVLAKEGTG